MIQFNELEREVKAKVNYANEGTIVDTAIRETVKIITTEVLKDLDIISKKRIM